MVLMPRLLLLSSVWHTVVASFFPLFSAPETQIKSNNSNVVSFPFSGSFLSVYVLVLNSVYDFDFSDV